MCRHVATVSVGIVTRCDQMLTCAWNGAKMTNYAACSEISLSVEIFTGQWIQSLPDGMSCNRCFQPWQKLLTNTTAKNCKKLLNETTVLRRGFIRGLVTLCYVIVWLTIKSHWSFQESWAEFDLKKATVQLHFICIRIYIKLNITNINNWHCFVQ